MTNNQAECVFCAIAAGQAPATVLREWDNALAIKPRGGVNDGHTLVIPRTHVANAIEDPATTGMVMTHAAEYAAELGTDLNLITSVGAAATQSVFHLHAHVLPRAEGDGLPLPWTPQQQAARKADAPHTEPPQLRAALDTMARRGKVVELTAPPVFEVEQSGADTHGWDPDDPHGDIEEYERDAR